MRVFLDANILVSVLNKEFPLYTYSARVLSLADNRKFTIVTTPICLAIAYYFAEKKHGTENAKKKIAILLEHIKVINCGEKEAKEVIENKKAPDFEDALQYYSAINAKCNCIVTNDLSDYFFSKIDVVGPDTFLQKYG